jgi:hypothetical protein
VSLAALTTRFLLPALASALVLCAAALPGSAAASTLVDPFASAADPQGVAVDTAGNVYIADTAANEIVKVTPAGALSVLAGTGTAGSPTPGPATHSELRAPAGVAVDSNGDVYIADTGNAEVEKVTASRALSIVAGTGTTALPVPGTATASPLDTPTGVAVDAAGNVYIADSTAHEILKLAPAGTLSIFAGNGTTGLPTPGTATASPLDAPTGIAVDSAGNVYIADAAANEIEKVTGSGDLSLFAGRSTGAAGAPTAGTATSSHLSQPTGIAVDISGNVYIADTANDRIEKVSAGRLSTFAGTGSAAAPNYGAAPTSSAIPGPTAVAVNAAGVVYVADAPNDTVDRLAPAVPVATAGPTVTGTSGTQGVVLSARNGSWSNSPSSFSYQWEDCNTSGASCTSITGATAATYTLQPADVARTVRVAVTATNAGGDGSSVSAPTATVLPLPPSLITAPSVAGETIDAQTLTVTTGTWANGTTKFAYQWQDCSSAGDSCANIGGATSPAYTLQGSDVGDTLRAQVTATNAGGSTVKSSAVTDVVGPALVPWANVAAPQATSAPAITGTAIPGATLTCKPGSWTGGPTGFTYQWNRGTRLITGATGQTYKVQTADSGWTLSCSVIAVNSGGAIQADSAGVHVGTPGAHTAAAGEHSSRVKKRLKGKRAPAARTARHTSRRRRSAAHGSR